MEKTSWQLAKLRESAPSLDDLGGIEEFDIPLERATLITNIFMKWEHDLGPGIAAECTMEDENISVDVLYKCLARAGKGKYIKHLKKMLHENENEDVGDVSDFPTLPLADSAGALIALRGLDRIYDVLDRHSADPLFIPQVCEELRCTPNAIIDFIDQNISSHIAAYLRKKQMQEATSDDNIDSVEAFEKPITVPILYHCPCCGCPMGPDGVTLNYHELEGYSPDKYPESPYPCPACEESLDEPKRWYVTREMALDAGDPSLEGTEY